MQQLEYSTIVMGRLPLELQQEMNASGARPPIVYGKAGGIGKADNLMMGISERERTSIQPTHDNAAILHHVHLIRRLGNPSDDLRQHRDLYHNQSLII
jgi:hypothetical protein